MVTRILIGEVAQIPKGEGRLFAAAGRRVAVFHVHSGEVFATQAECPHLQGPLADGLTAGTTVVCPLHDRAYDIPVSSTKSQLGHLRNSCALIEIIACLHMLDEQKIAPTINYDEPDPECDLDYVPNTARKAQVDIAMSNSFGFGGHNTSLLIGKL